MNISTVLYFIVGLVILFIILKVIALPIKIIIKLLLNGLVGGIILYVINLIGANIGFTLPLEWWSAILVGLLGIPGVVILAIIQLFI